MNKKMEWLVDKRNYLFLGMCYGVHIFLLILFAILGIWGMVILNLFSAAYYTWITLIRKDFSENAIVVSYFEIIFFAAISTIMLGRHAGFLLYIVGMISVVFYLSYHHQNKRFLYQGIGAVIVLLLVIFEPWINTVFLQYKGMIEPHNRIFYLMNLVITLVTVVIVSFLYAQEINRMNKEIDDMNAELDYQASHDELTGLLNRHEMNHFIDQVTNRSVKQIMVAMMDIDDFKKINDTYGHDAGDLALKEVAKLLAQHLSEFKVARWGGEEFLVVGDECEQKRGAEAVERFHNAVKDLKLDYKGHSIDVYMTVGLVFGDEPGKINHMILEADNLLYIGKKNGKNCVLTYDNIKEYTSEA